MTTSNAELSSIASQLEQLTKRITALAESASSSHEADMASELFGIERSLAGARRRIDKLTTPRRR